MPTIPPPTWVPPPPDGTPPIVIDPTPPPPPAPGPGPFPPGPGTRPPTGVTQGPPVVEKGFGTIKGVVREITQTGWSDPVSGATVKIDGIDRSTQSNSNGNYTFTEVPEGSYDLISEKNGYLTTRSLNVLVRANQETTRDILMAPQATQSGQTGITGTVKDYRNGDLLSDVEIRVVGTEITTKTGADGSYTLLLRAGQYTIRAYKPGYTVEFRENVYVTENLTLVNFALIKIPDPNPPPPPPPPPPVDLSRPVISVSYGLSNINRHYLLLGGMRDDDYSVPINILKKYDYTPIFRINVISYIHPLNRDYVGGPVYEKFIDVKKPRFFSGRNYVWFDLTDEDCHLVLESAGLYEHNYTLYIKKTFTYPLYENEVGLKSDKIYRIGIKAVNALWFVDPAEGITESQFAFIVPSSGGPVFHMIFVGIDEVD
jgi:hypothetical protein